MKKVILFFIATVFVSCQQLQKNEQVTTKNNSILNNWIIVEEPNFSLYYKPNDKKHAQQISNWIKTGQRSINIIFGRDFKQKFDIYIFNDRDSLNKQWQKDWNMPEFKSQCWMVASGIAHRLDILSPGIWKTQACEHDAEDTVATKKLLSHELVHVFHGQYNPSPTFEDIENIDWFIEGLAVFASGQLDAERYKRTENFILNNEGPQKLADIWKGENKYGLAGSMVKYIDDKYGREVLIKLIQHTKATEILTTLDVSEEELIQGWKQSFK